MNSAEHRANILNNSYQEVGFGFASSANFNGSGPETVVVAMYGLPASSTIGLSAQVPATAENSSLSANAQTLPSKNVSHLAVLMDGNAPWALFVVSSLLGACIALLVVKHGMAWHKKLLRGEAFVLRHPLLDIIVVSGVMAMFVLTRSAGFIR
jgi:hypothetical protein